MGNNQQLYGGNDADSLQGGSGAYQYLSGHAGDDTLVAGVGYVLAQNQGTASNFYMLVAAAMVAYGALTAAAIWLTPWGPKPREIT